MLVTPLYPTSEVPLGCCLPSCSGNLGERLSINGKVFFHGSTDFVVQDGMMEKNNKVIAIAGKSFSEAIERSKSAFNIEV